MSFQWQRLECLEGMQMLCLQNQWTALSQKRGIVLLRPQGLLHWTLQTKMYRAAERAKLPSQAASTSTSVFDSGPQRRKSKGLPILPDFLTELQSSWKAPSSTALPRTQLGNLAGAETYGLATAPLKSDPHLLCWLELWPGLEGMLQLSDG